MYDAPIRDGNGSLHPLLHHLIAKRNIGTRFQRSSTAFVPSFFAPALA